MVKAQGPRHQLDLVVAVGPLVAVVVCGVVVAECAFTLFADG